MIDSWELGGKKFAKTLIVNILSDTGGANVNVLSFITGLPAEITRQILYDLEDQNKVRVGLNGSIWHINEEILI